MATFDEIKDLSGKKVIMWTKNGTFYTGIMSNPRTGERDKDYVAIVDFDCRRYFTSSTTDGPKKTSVKEKYPQFPIRSEDIVYEFQD